MKRIIEKKVYDTETATMVATTSFGQSNDFKSFAETLYRTAKGNYFLQYVRRRSAAAGWAAESADWAGQGWCAVCLGWFRVCS